MRAQSNRRPAPLTKAAGDGYTGPERSVSRIINQGWDIMDTGLMQDRALQMLAASSTEGFLNALPWTQFAEHLGQTVEPISTAVGKAISQELGTIGHAGAQLSMTSVDALSHKYAQEQAGQLIRNISDSQRATIRGILSTAQAGEYTTDQAAREIRKGIGLHPAWAQAVTNYGNRLAAQPVPKGYSAARWQATIDQRVTRYRERLINKRSQNIARTEIITAENLGRYATWSQAIGAGTADVNSRKEWAPGPGACKLCESLAGEIVAWDAPFSNGTIMPPAHPSCLPATSRIVVPADISERFAHSVATSGGLSDASKLTAATVADAVGNGSWVGISAVTTRHYVGDFIDIVTELGHKLTITPNHPVATRTGFVPAGMIREGDDVLCRIGRDQAAPHGPDVEDVEATIKEVADALPVAFGPMPTAAEDFHGDGTEGQVYVIRAAGVLLNDGETAVSQSASESSLVGADVPELYGISGGSTSKVSGGLGATTDGVMRGLGKSKTPLDAELSHAHVHGSGAAARLNPSDEQVPSDHAAADAEGFCEGLLADSPEIGYAKVVEVKRYFAHTEVYNCNTTDGWYVADGIVVHNCRCGANLLPPEYTTPGLNPRGINWTNPAGDAAAIDETGYSAGRATLDALSAEPAAREAADEFNADNSSDGADTYGEDITDPAITPQMSVYERDLQAMQQAAQATKADQLTYESTLHWSDEKLMAHIANYENDPEAMDRIFDIIDQRAVVEDAKAAAQEMAQASYNAEQAAKIHADLDAAAQRAAGTLKTEPSPALNPAVRPERNLNAYQQVGEEFQHYMYSQYDAALKATNGNFFNAANKAAAEKRGYDSIALFSGPYRIAKKYASEELLRFWETAGRDTLGSYRYRALGRPSDRKAFDTVVREGLGRKAASYDRSNL